jgi:polar amino acid transport system substrate-binding protein
MSNPARPALVATLLALGSLLAACTIDGDDAAIGPTTSTTASSPTGSPAPDPGCDPANARPSFPPLAPLPAPGQMPPGSFMAEVQQKGTLVVGVSQDTYLFSYLRPETGEIEGFDVDIAKEIARAIFGDLEKKVELRPILSAQRPEKLRRDEVDLVAQTMTITCERWALISFSSVYYEAGQSVLVRSDSQANSIDDLAGKKVCAVTGTTSIAKLRKDTDVEAVESPAWATCLLRMQEGEVDAVSTDNTILAGLAAQDPYTRVVEAEPFTEEPYGLGVNKDHPEFVQFVNGVLAKMRADGTWQRIYDKWLLSTLHEQSPPDPGPTRPVT